MHHIGNHRPKATQPKLPFNTNGNIKNGVMAQMAEVMMRNFRVPNFSPKYAAIGVLKKCKMATISIASKIIALSMPANCVV